MKRTALFCTSCRDVPIRPFFFFLNNSIGSMKCQRNVLFFFLEVSESYRHDWLNQRSTWRRGRFVCVFVFFCFLFFHSRSEFFFLLSGAFGTNIAIHLCFFFLGMKLAEFSHFVPFFGMVSPLPPVFFLRHLRVSSLLDFPPFFFLGGVFWSSSFCFLRWEGKGRKKQCFPLAKFVSNQTKILEPKTTTETDFTQNSMRLQPNRTYLKQVSGFNLGLV